MRSILVLVGVAVLCVGIALLVPLSAAQPATHDGPDVHAWEYKVVDVASMVEIRGMSLEDREKMAADLEEGLNQLGTEGWEFSFEMRGPMVFKRPK